MIETKEAFRAPSKHVASHRARETIVKRLMTAMMLTVLIPLLGPGIASAGAPSGGYTGPLFDAHSHVNPSNLSAERLIALARGAGLSGVILFGPSEHTLRAQRENPEFAFPFADIPRDRRTRQLLLNEETLASLQEQLETGVMRGIGEIPWRHFPNPEDGYPADGPIALQVYDLAASYNVPVTVHVEYEYSGELERALEHNREVVIIWAHAGDAQPALIGELMRKHGNLYADLSARNPFFRRRLPPEEQSPTNEDGVLKAEWRSVLEEFPDRFLFGLDLGSGDRHSIITELMEYYRTVLAQLTPETAEKIAHETAESLVGGDPR
jgi:hypothetical protein